MAAYAIQFRRGTTTQHSSFTGLLGEVTVDTDKKTLVVHDGSTTGGYPLMREGASATSSTGSFSSNVTIGGTLAVTNAATLSGGAAITGDLDMTGHIIPAANITYDLGSSTMMWRDIYVGPGSLYVNGKKVIDDDSGTIQISTTQDQNLKVATSGTGTLQIQSANGIAIDGEINTSSGDIQVGDHIDMNSNLLKEVATPVSGTDAANKNYVDGAITTGIGAGTAAISGTTLTTSGNATIGGNLTVSGTTTTINTSQINLADNILLLNSDATGNATASGGIEIERGDDLNVQLLWDESNDRWSVGAEDLYSSGSFIGNLTGDVTGQSDTVAALTGLDTDDLTEGTYNQYHTTQRVRDAISVSGDLTYDSSTGVISTQGLASSDTDDLAEGSTNLYYTNARWDTRLGTKDTDDLTEGTTNLYYTDARADARIAAADSDDISEGTANLFYTDTRVNTYLTNNSYATQAYVTSAVQGKDALSELSGDTDDVTEGSTNLYYTNARADARVDAGFTAKDTDDLSEGSTNLYYTTARWDTKMAAADTDDLSEGSTNLYFTNERVDDRIGAMMTAGTGISLSYDDAAGTMTVTNTQTEVNDYVDGATFSGGTLTLSVGTQSDVTVSLDGRYAQLGNTSKKHTHAYETTAQDETDNTGSSKSITWATLTSGKISLGSDAVDFASEINDSPYAVVYINRIMARPNEVTITSTGLTFASDVLAEDDEVEVVYMDEQ